MSVSRFWRLAEACCTDSRSLLFVTYSALPARPWAET
jgi:hypothetical protein